MPTDGQHTTTSADTARDQHIQRLIDAAPPLTAERVARLRALRDGHLTDRDTTHAEAS